VNSCIQGSPKKTGTLCFIRLNFIKYIDRFSKLFHYKNQENICYNTVAKDLTTPQVHVSTLLSHGRLWS